MRWIDRSAMAVALLATMMMSGEAWGDALVVRANGPSATTYPIGRKLPDTARLRLASGDAITLIDAHGTRVLRGPGVFSASATAAPTASAASDLAQNGGRRARIGAVRSISGIGTQRPSLWMIDVSKPGTVCLLDASAPALWRPHATGAATVTIASSAGGESARADWEPGQSSTSWPTGLTASDGRGYRLSGLDPTPVDITVKVIAAPGADLPSAASALIAAGCQAQLDQLIATSLRAG